MPANLTPQYLSAEERHKAAGTPEEKLETLKEMIALLPKHKGTEKIHANLKKRLSKLNNLAQQAQKKTGGGSPFDHIDREGAGQVALVGLPNAGKSTLVNLLTNADAEAADYPFSTLKPSVGMAHFKDTQIQLIDLPPVSEAYTENWVYNLIRNADRVCLLIDLSAGDPEEIWVEILGLLEQHKLTLVGGKDASDAFGPSTGVQKAIVAGTKADLADPGRVDAFEQMVAEDFDHVIVGRDRPLDAFLLALFLSLDVVRIYSKEPGKPADNSQPFVLRRGSTTTDLAAAIHKDVAKRIKYACVWGSAQFDGQRVPLDYELQDGDVVEVHR